MVRAILAGVKTQTRRAVKLPLIDRNGTGCEIAGCEINSCLKQGMEICPYGSAGDHLWVKETHYWDRFDKMPKSKPDDFPMDFYYRADGECCDQIPECQCGSEGKTQWRPSIFMPRWSSRITLRIVSVRVERLQEISEEDANAEGIEPYGPDDGRYKVGYSELWDEINGRGSWKANPWVWVVTFKQVFNAQAQALRPPSKP